MALLFLFLTFTLTGKAMRAVADNPMLADSKGIDPDRMARLAIGIGMGLAGIGGMLVGLDTSIDPLVGFRAILSVFAAAVVGGLGSVPGAVVGGLAIGLAEELSLLVLAPTYKGVVGFLAILVILLLRPGGILGSARNMTNYLIAMATFASIYAILALGLNVMWGMAGMVNLGIVGFYGFGAYISALLTVKGHAPIAVGFAAAMIGTAIMGALVTLGLTRLRDDYLAIVTLGFAEAMRIVAENEIWLTKGTDGISGIPQPLKSVLGPDFNAVYLAFCLVVLAIVLLVLERVRSSPFGRVLRAIREDPQVAAFSGKDVLKFKVKAFAIGGALAGPRRRALRALFELHRAGNLRAAADDLHLPRAHRRRHRQQLGRGDRRIRRGVLPRIDALPDRRRPVALGRAARRAARIPGRSAAAAGAVSAPARPDAGAAAEACNSVVILRWPRSGPRRIATSRPSRLAASAARTSG